MVSLEPVPEFSAMACTADGMRVIGVERSRRAYVMWDAGSGGETVRVPWAGLPAVVALDPSGRTVAVTQDATVLVGDSGGASHAIVGEHPGRITALAWSADGGRLASGDGEGSVRVWDVRGVRGAQDVPDVQGERDVQGARMEASYTVFEPDGGFGRRVRSLAWHPDGRRLLVCGQGGQVVLVAVDSGRREEVLAEKGRRMQAAAFSAADGALVVAGQGGTACLWTASGDQVPLDGHTDTVMAVAFSADGLRVATGAMDTFVRVWDAATGQPVTVLAGLGGWVRALGFTADGIELLACDGGGKAVRWNAATAEVVAMSRVKGASAGAGAALSDPLRQSRPPRGWEIEAGFHDWERLHCGCSRGAVHVPADFAALVAARTAEEADGAGLENDVQVEALLYDSAVPLTSMILAALQGEDLAPPARWRMFDLLLGCVTGDTHAAEYARGVRDIEDECQFAARAGIPLFYRELTNESVPGIAERVYEILQYLDEDPPPPGSSF